MLTLASYASPCQVVHNIARDDNDSFVFTNTITTVLGTH